MALNTELRRIKALNAKLKILKALNARNVEPRTNDGTECWNWEEMVALNTEDEKMVALNAKTENMMALNAKMENEQWLWMPKWKMNNDSERQNENEQWLWTPNWEEILTLNAKLWMLMTLNAEAEKWWWLWTPKLRRDNGFECQVEDEWWLWRLN